MTVHPDEIALGQLVAVRFVWQHMSSDGNWIDTLGMPWFWTESDARRNSPPQPSRLVGRYMYDLEVTA